jgi:hypothetical protein
MIGRKSAGSAGRNHDEKDACKRSIPPSNQSPKRSVIMIFHLVLMSDRLNSRTLAGNRCAIRRFVVKLLKSISFDTGCSG